MYSMLYTYPTPSKGRSLNVRRLFCLCLLLTSSSLLGQSRRMHDIRLQRFFAKYVTSFVFGIYQGQIDEDSASVLACAGEHLPHSLIYDELYDNGADLPGKQLMDEGQIGAAKNLLARLQGDDRIRLLLQLANYYIHKPGIAKKDADSALLYAQLAAQQSSTLRNIQLLEVSYLTLGKLYFQMGDTTASSSYINKVLNNQRKKGSAKGLGIALSYRGDCAPYFHPSRITDYNEAVGLFRSIKDTMDEILTQNKLFTIYFVKGMYDTVRQELYHTMDFEKAMGLQELHYNYTVIAFIDEELNRPNEALVANTEAIRIMDATADTAFSDIFYSKMGELMLYYRDPDESLRWFNKSLAKRKPGGSRLWYNTFLSLASSMYKLDKSKDCIDLIESTIRQFPPVNALEKTWIELLLGQSYKEIGRLDVAQEHLYAAVSAATALLGLPENYTMLGFVYMEYAELRLRLHDLATAESYLEKAITLSADSKERNLTEYHLVQYKIDSVRGNTELAWNHYRRMRNLLDSSNGVDRARQLEEFRVKFDIAQNEKDLKLLQNQSALQQSQLQKAAFTRKISLAGVVMLLLLLALVYSRFRLKQKQQQEIAEKNQALQELLEEKDQLIEDKDDLIEEKEWLIKEIHHRVKNNLQMVVSLLTAQSAHLNNKEALQAIRESEQRMYAMSLIHQKLYQSEKMELIEMSAYIRELTGYLNAHSSVDDRVRFELDLEPVKLDVGQAVPLGLILNEAITNAIKYAFADNVAGTVSISLRHLPGQKLELCIADDGRGLPEHVDVRRTKSLGITLMKGLSQQLKGELKLVNYNGLQVILCFPLSFFAAPVDKKARTQGETIL